MTRTVAVNYTAAGTNFPKADAGSDPFLKEDVQDLAAAVDEHDHSSTRGLAVQRLGSGIVVEGNLANDAVTFDKLADHASTDSLRAVGANHIRDDAIITRTIDDGAVTATKLGTGAWSGLTFPRCYAGYTVNSQTPVTATLTAVSFTAADIYDNFAGHSPSVNPERITIATAGWYMLFGYAQWAANATGARELYFRFTRSAVTTYLQVADAREGMASQPIRVSVSAPFELQAADYVEMVVYQASGGGLILQDAGFGVTAFGS
jgi:hypothetical protein